MMWVVPTIASLLLLSVCREMAYAQGNELVIVPGVRASRLSGAVGMAVSEEPLPGVLVIRFSCGSGAFRGSPDPVAIEQTKTDANGRFVFRWGGKNRACLQFQMPGMNLLQMEVKKTNGAGEIHARLAPGT